MKTLFYSTVKRNLHRVFLVILLIIVLLSGAAAQNSCPSGQSLIHHYTGYGVNVSSYNNCRYPYNSIGYFDINKFTEVDASTNPANKGWIIIDMGEIIPNGDTIYYIASGHDDNMSTWEVSASTDGTTFGTPIAYSQEGRVETDYSFIVNVAAGARYFKLYNTGTHKAVRLDNVSYKKKECKAYCLGASIAYATGWATSVVSGSTATNTAEALGAPNLSGATFNNSGTQILYLDLGTTVPFGSYVQLFLSYGDAGANFQVSASATTSNYTNIENYIPQSQYNNYPAFHYLVSQEGGARYIKIAVTNAKTGRVDAVGYRYPTYFGKSYIEGTVFNDANDNGVLDGGETGTSGISVRLYRDVNNNSVLDATDSLKQTKSTGAGGAYAFNVTSISRYLVNVNANTLPVNHYLDSTTIKVANVTDLNQTHCSNTAGDNNFGYVLDHAPVANEANQTYTNPEGTLQAEVPQLTGSDEEDGILGNGDIIVIKTLPANGTLYYNGVAVTVNQVISNYNNTLLTFDPGFAGYGTSTFTFTVRDSRGQEDATPATVTLIFNSQFILQGTVTNNPTCKNASTGKAYVTVLAGVGPYSYLWSNGQTTDTATALSPGIHKVIVSDFYGAIDSVFVNVSEPARDPDAVLWGCVDATGYKASLSVINPAPYTGVWRKALGPGNLSSTTSLTPTMSHLSAAGIPTTIQWIVTDASGCKDTTALVISPPPVIGAIASAPYDVELCPICPEMDGDELNTFVDETGKPVADLVTDNPSADLSNTDICMILLYDGTPTAADIPYVFADIYYVQPFLPRVWAVQSETEETVSMGLFFTNTEFTALRQAAMGTQYEFNSVNELWATVYDEAGVAPGAPNGVAYAPSFLSVGSNWQARLDNIPSTSTVFLHPSRFAGAPLPVQLSLFEATALKSTIVLNWETASETGSKSFEVERSLDGVVFSKIAEVAAAGSSTTKRSYQQADAKVKPGIKYYYRLKQTDYKGAFAYSPIESATIKGVSTEIAIGDPSPNPSKNLTHVQVNTTSSTSMRVMLMSLDGTVIMQSEHELDKGLSNISIDLSKVSPGTYICHFITGGGNFTHKVVKMN